MAHIRFEGNQVGDRGVATLTEDGATIDRGASTVLVAHAEGVQVEELELKALAASDAADLNVDSVIVDELGVSTSPSLQLEDSEVRRHVHVVGSSDSRLSSVSLQADPGSFLNLVESPRTTIEGLDLAPTEGRGYSGIDLEASPGTVLGSSDLTQASIEIASSDVAFTQNEVSDARIEIDAGDGTDLTQNWMNDTQVDADGSDDVRIEGNVIRGGVHGGSVIANNTLEDGVIETRAEQITSNQISAGSDGIELEWPPSYVSEVHQNNLEGDLVAEDGVTANAENNWWGCPDGPTADACSDAVGNVDFDPWLIEPNPDAGSSLVN